MSNRIKYHEDEIVHSTVDGIIDFFINSPRSNKMTFSAKAMKHIYKYHNDPENCSNFYIGSQSLGGTNADITGGAYTGTTQEKDLNNYIVSSIPILFVVVNGEKIVLYDIIEYPGRTDHPEDFHVSITYSKYSMVILENLRKAKETVDKFKL